MLARQFFIQNNEFNQIKSHKLAVSNFVDILGYGQLTQKLRSLVHCVLILFSLHQNPFDRRNRNIQNNGNTMN